ncbi:hypothetical protein BJY00DRAFT_292578 [Aspergillus carlsbadensis]|nr:hypothetical protein BJY00DRAFT_292578 [Aspergillus carlsbadensis]
MYRIPPGRENMTAQFQRPLFSQPAYFFSSAARRRLQFNLAICRGVALASTPPRSRSSPIYASSILVAMIRPPASFTRHPGSSSSRSIVGALGQAVGSRGIEPLRVMSNSNSVDPPAQLWI